MAYDSSDDELPELNAILAPKPLMATSTNANLRRSPRKKGTVERCLSGSPEKKKPQDRNLSPTKSSQPAPARPTNKKVSSLGRINLPTPEQEPVLSQRPILTELCLTSNNRQSPVREERPFKIPHVDSLLLPRSAIVKQNEHETSNRVVGKSKTGSKRVLRDDGTSMMSLMTEAARKSVTRQSLQKKAQQSSYASRFILKEARCNDDEEDSIAEEEDEDTDLSGFIVDDDAELSYHDSSASESDREVKPRSIKRIVDRPRRRLVRGSPTRRRLSFLNDDSDNERKDTSPDTLADAFQDLGLHENDTNSATGMQAEVIELTSSPIASPKVDLKSYLPPTSSQPSLTGSKPAIHPDYHSSNPFNGSDTVVRLAPPASPTVMAPPTKMTRHDITDDTEIPGGETHDGFITPPRTPPKSKIHSPSKLLSPSKRQLVPRSPHRPSMDAFWDHNVVNDWNDEFSPKKSPAKSPKKGLARFQIYSDFEDDDNFVNTSSDSLPHSCTPPRHPSSKSQSPMKSPEKEEKKRLLDLKRAAVAKKKDFDDRKERLAIDLLNELDSKIAKSQLSTLAASSGGIHIIWSKTLRSTAGRANWKRTASKISGSPMKAGITEGPGIKVEHFASIELAEKIIDSEDRLVNTLAHEFCHLTNFMISNVRDQPHGASFKSWAAKVTNHLRNSEVDMWRKVEVTTKHDYAINHKYLWVCVGREQTNAMEFLNIEDDEGCGAEYGRHSKSIDTTKHRCGKCKGKLVQVRPKPRAPPSPKKQFRNRETSNTQRSSGSDVARSSSQGTMGCHVEMIELSD
ncbi:hypothetical protein LTR84_011551 [Exophiala bonariae]|uniref:SprT-like domain-containing protein n=1 Tax=Exophiala bonariae TaxID=1690606 RepID=A0AAV9NGR3_9EURO|nr:hypothetical protein LTR84_011551 [Exophiala bonariae]